MVTIDEASTDTRIEDVWKTLAHVMDPEIPVVSVVDLGIVRDVALRDGHLDVTITPTYSGCPATQMIENEVRVALDEAGYASATITTALSPPWTTDWIGPQAREKLRSYGIAPPQADTIDKRALFPERAPVVCPRCASRNTRMVSEFGSTACKAHYKCRDCLEPFDYFKCI